MMRRRGSVRRTWPTAAIVLYSLGMLTILAVALSLGGAETTPARWALIAVPVALVAAARARRPAGAARRARRPTREPQTRSSPGVPSTSEGGLLPLWGAALLLAGYGLAFAAAGTRLVVRREIT